MSDSKKDAVETVATVGVAALAVAAGSPLAIALAAVPGLVGIGFEKIGARVRKRSARIIQRMIETDESPREFADFLNARLMDEDEEVVLAMRTLLAASVDAVALAAIEPMALLGRRYLKQQAPAWIARGWTRVIAELTDSEIAALRAIVVIGSKTWARLKALGGRPSVELTIHRQYNSIEVSGAMHEFYEGLSTGAHATRLIDLIAGQQLGRHRMDAERITTRARADRSMPVQHKERFTFHHEAFLALADAFPTDSAPMHQPWPAEPLP